MPKCECPLDKYCLMHGQRADMNACREEEKSDQLVTAISNSWSNIRAHDENPALVERLYQVWNYTSALANWIAAGRPQRPPEEVQQIYQLCIECPNVTVTPTRTSCQLCGCRLSKENDISNKIMMETEHCPIEVW